MKVKNYLFALLFLITTFSSQAAYFRYFPYTINQPDGTKISCFVSGDEYFNWIHDADGYTIIQSQKDGYYYYATKLNEKIVPSKYLVGSVDISTTGLDKWIKISLEAYNKKKEEYSKYMTSPSKSVHTGTLNNIVVYIRFNDDTEFSNTRQTFDDKFNPTASRSLRNYFTEVSYNKLTISSTHYPVCAMTTNLSYKDSHNRNYYQPYNATTNPGGYNGGTESRDREHQLLVNAVNYIASQVPTGLNIDADNDGNVDNVCFIIRGNCDGWSDLLWAHRWVLYTQTVYINSKRVYDYTFQPENQNDVTTLCHEMFHSVGAPDLYHYTSNGISPCGPWDIMDGGAGHMTAYMKWKYAAQQWIASIPQITTSGTYTLNPITSSTNNCYKIASPNSSTEFFVVEYRKMEGTYESYLPGSGLIVYRINTAYTGNASGPPDEVYVYRPNGTTTADGNPYSANFSLDAGRTSINDATNPSSFLTNGSNGGLKISNIGTAGATISFDVNFPLNYCSSKSNSSTFEWISKVAVGNFSNSSGAATYTDFTNNFINLTAGQTAGVTLTPGFSSTIYNESWRIWIDYNKDGDFTDAGEEVFSPAISSSIVSGSFTVPSSASGQTRMRISMKWNAVPTPCETFGYGEVEDYTVNIACATQGNNSNYEYIGNVTVGGFSKTSGASGYSDFTSDIVPMVVGNNSISLTPVFPYSIYTEYFKVWIDFNKDGDYNDAGEEVYSSGATTSAVSGTITIPASYEGQTRMRVSMKYAGIPTPCETFAYGEVEDYTVAISCASAGSNFSYEYIGNVTVGSFSKTSGGSSYSDYTTDIIPVVAGSNSLTLTPVFPGSVYVEYWSIWVDFNKDGDFTDSGEQLFAPAGSTSVVSGSITIPSSFTGSARLRVTMKYAAAPVPCETFSYGEVEDYTVMMSAAKLAIDEVDITEFNIYPNPANKILFIQSPETKSDMCIYNALGSLMMKKQLNNTIEEIDISNFANGIYTICITKNNQVQVKKFIKN